MEWRTAGEIASRQYTCGYCGTAIASQRGFYAFFNGRGDAASIYICHQCNCPTFFDVFGEPTPGALIGNEVPDVDESVGSLYGEARRAYAAGSFTAAVLCSRTSAVVAIPLPKQAPASAKRWMRRTAT